MGVASELGTQIKNLMGSTSQRLIELTNPDGNSATTINDTILDQACEFAMGEFRFRSGFEPDTATPNFTHISILFHGVLWVLENQKGRDTTTTENHRKNFQISLNDLRRRAYQPATTSSPFVKTKADQGSRTDMDNSNSVFSNRRRNNVREINED